MGETKLSTQEQINEAIARGIAEGLKARRDDEMADVLTRLAPMLRPQDPLEQAGLSPGRIAQIKQPPTPKRWREVRVRFPSGATALANVVESETLKGGRITALADYRHPHEAYVHQSEKGRVPDGFPIWAGGNVVSIPDGEEPANGSLDRSYLHWRWENFYQRDLRDYNGGELTATICADPNGMDTPWQKGHSLAQAHAA